MAAAVKEPKYVVTALNNLTGEREAVFQNMAPEWARKLFMEKYGIKLIGQ